MTPTSQLTNAQITRINFRRRLLRRTYLVLAFIPFFAATLTRIAADWTINALVRGDERISRRFPILRKFAE